MPHPPPHNSFYSENLVNLRLLLGILFLLLLFDCCAPKGRLLFPIMGGNEPEDDDDAPWNMDILNFLYFTNTNTYMYIKINTEWGRDRQNFTGERKKENKIWNKINGAKLNVVCRRRRLFTRQNLASLDMYVRFIFSSSSFLFANAHTLTYTHTHAQTLIEPVSRCRVYKDWRAQTGFRFFIYTHLIHRYYCHKTNIYIYTYVFSQYFPRFSFLQFFIRSFCRLPLLTICSSAFTPIFA